MNKLEAVLASAEKLLQKQVDEKPNSGIIFDKGTEKERRLKYADSLALIQKYRGWASFKVCGSCRYWDQRSGIQHYMDREGWCKKSPDPQKVTDCEHHCPLYKRRKL